MEAGIRKGAGRHLTGCARQHGTDSADRVKGNVSDHIVLDFADLYGMDKPGAGEEEICAGIQQGTETAGGNIWGGLCGFLSGIRRKRRMHPEAGVEPGRAPSQRVWV